mgnify:FL=1|tara:strand:+ start:9997 stop:11082 length:1086 start_codon:yes stop_codon:yes gene_type:complete
MKKIITIVGARPQFVKASQLSKAFLSHDNLNEIILHTGQHYDHQMSEIFFQELGIQSPSYNLEINNLDHGEMTGKMMIEIEKILIKDQPDAVVVFGDTNSTLAGALAAAKLNIPVAHIESGIRSFNKSMPEEINRIVTDSISNWLFAPTKIGEHNLIMEGHSTDKIFNYGDVMYDVSLSFASKNPSDSILDYLDNDFLLVTIHRPENTENDLRLKNIADSLIEIASKFKIIFPIHPRTIKAFERINMFDKLSKIIDIIDPISYVDMLQMQKKARLIITDSGGMQKEAYFLKTPCVTLRDETEWVELIEAGWNKLIKTSSKKEKIVSEILGSINKKGLDYDYYGDGKSSYKIADQIMGDLNC